MIFNFAFAASIAFWIAIKVASSKPLANIRPTVLPAKFVIRMGKILFFVFVTAALSVPIGT
jgi:hypothetical protein